MTAKIARSGKARVTVAGAPKARGQAIICHAGTVIARGLPLVPDGALLVANGKQALSLVAQDLRDHGVRTLLAPDFYCLTMIQPFQLEGIRIRHVATDAQALLDADALTEALAASRHPAVLHCEVFGTRAGAALRDVLDSAQVSGVPVVVDATHSVFAPDHDPADYLVASMRKLLPLPDGAFVTGTMSCPTRPRRRVDRAATRLGLLAAQHRRDFLGGRGSAAGYLQALDAAEAAMLDAGEPVDMSYAALRQLECLDVDILRDGRRANAHHLIQRLTSSGCEVLNPETGECGVVVHVRDAQSAENDLLAAGIVCPISWPRPPGLPHGVPWRTGWITLPVDPDLPVSLLDSAASTVRNNRTRYRGEERFGPLAEDVHVGMARVQRRKGT